MSYHSILAPSHATVQAAKPALGSNLREDAGPNFNESLFPLLQSLQPPTGQVLRVVCGVWGVTTAGAQLAVDMGELLERAEFLDKVETVY